MQFPLTNQIGLLTVIAVKSVCSVITPAISPRFSNLTKIAIPGKQKSLQLTCQSVTLKGGEDSLLSERLGFNFEVLFRLLPFVDFILSLIIILRSYQSCCVLLY